MHATTILQTYGRDKGPMTLAIGNLENSVVLLGYNQLPYYELVVEGGEPGLAWCIDPNYTPPNSPPVMEAYLQFLGSSFNQGTVRRPFMTQIVRATGRITETALVGGDSISLNLHDGTPGQGMVGKPALRITPRGLEFGGGVLSASGGQLLWNGKLVAIQP